MMTAAERQRSCANAEAIWAALGPVMLRAVHALDYPPTIAHLRPDSPMRFSDEDKSFPPAQFWVSADNYWLAGEDSRRHADAKSIADAHRERRVPSPALYRQWARTPETSIFECSDFAAKRALEPATPAGEPEITLGVALPMVSSDGLSALAYAMRTIRSKDGSSLDEGYQFHLVKSGTAWRVAGVHPAFRRYAHSWTALETPRPRANPGDNEKGPASPPGP